MLVTNLWWVCMCECFLPDERWIRSVSLSLPSPFWGSAFELRFKLIWSFGVVHFGVWDSVMVSFFLFPRFSLLPNVWLNPVILSFAINFLLPSMKLAPFLRCSSSTFDTFLIDLLQFRRVCDSFLFERLGLRDLFDVDFFGSKCGYYLLGEGFAFSKLYESLNDFL